MLKIIKRLPIGTCAVAIAFLLVQIACALYLPRATADTVDKGMRLPEVYCSRSRTLNKEVNYNET